MQINTSSSSTTTTTTTITTGNNGWNNDSDSDDIRDITIVSSARSQPDRETHTIESDALSIIQENSSNVIFRHELVVMPFQVAGHSVDKGHKGFLTVPAEIVEYDRLVRTGQRGRESGGGSFSDNSRAELVDNLPTLAPERKRLLELLPATDIIFKPVLAYKKKSEKEIEFYERMLQLVPELRPFVPTYYGIRHVVDKRDNERSAHIVLQDLTRGFKRPSIIDIKIGQQTYVDSAPEEKKQRELSKNPYQRTIGFRISGMKVHRCEPPNTGEESVQVLRTDSGYYVKFDHTWGRGKRPGRETRESLEHFFFDGKGMRTHVIPSYMEHLESMLRVFRQQTQLRFIASSLLLIYESDESELRKAECAGEPVPTVCKIVDFVHTHRITEPNTRDEGFIYGLEQLMKYFSSIFRLHHHHH